jgi:hypothetical protein
LWNLAPPRPPGLIATISVSPRSGLVVM